MQQQPTIRELRPKKLIGMWQDMSRVNDKTRELWGDFSPRVGEIVNLTNEDKISMQVYPEGPKQLSSPMASFIKWAAVEVEDYDAIPLGMESYNLSAGTYAVFIHHGPASDLSTIIYIFTEWLPNSMEYELADREHFEVLPIGYSPVDPNATEEIWIPVRLKTSDVGSE